MTHAERILAYLAARPGRWFDDDELSTVLGIQPRQTVNQVCRRLAAERRIARGYRSGKLHNAVAVAGKDPHISTAPHTLAGSRRIESDQAEAVSLLLRCANALARLNLAQPAVRLREAAAGRDPRQALAGCRWALERLLAADVSASLAAAIDQAFAPSGDAAIVRSHMHTVRILGNEAVHGASAVAWADVRVAAGALLQAVSQASPRHGHP